MNELRLYLSREMLKQNVSSKRFKYLQSLKDTCIKYEKILTQYNFLKKTIRDILK